MQQPCGECEFVCNSGIELENHVKEKHETNKVNIETKKDESVILDDQKDTLEEIFQCGLCDFKSTNSPGIMSHKTKRHKNEHPCDQCSGSLRFCCFPIHFTLPQLFISSSLLVLNV